MQYKIDWIEKKTDTWAIASLIEMPNGTQTLTEISINKLNKDTTIAFPTFDTLMPGSIIEGNLWKSPTTGKHSLFPIRPAPKSDGEATARNTPAPSRGFGGASKAMETKAANIEKAQETTFKHVTQAQDNKNKGIMLAAAFRDATLLLTNLPAYAEMNMEEVRDNHKAFVDWYIKSWDEQENKIDIPY